MTMDSIVQGFDTPSANTSTQTSVTDTTNMPADNAVAPSSVNDTDSALLTCPTVKPGMISKIKNLYQGKKDDYGNRPWVETYPDDLDDPVENEKTARFALLIRNKKCHSGRKKLTVASIVVQSPLLKNALKPVFENYPGITTTLERLQFEPPFAAFVYRWNGFCAAVTNEQDPTVKEHLDLLHRVLEEEMKDDIKARDDLLAHNVITYDYLWMLFEPGSVVVATKGEQDQAVLLTNGDYTTACNSPVYSLTCQNVDWDGSNFGYGSARYNIAAFSGTAPISSLSAFPMMYHPQKDEVTERLIARGKVFECLSGYNYKQYQGIAMGDGPWGPIRYNVNSRVIIDTYAWNRFQPNSQVSVSTFEAKSNSTNAGAAEDSDDDDDDEDYDNLSSEEDGNRSSAPVKAKNPRPLTDDKLLLCTSTLKGYALKNKKWMTFSIENVKEMKWNEKAFDSLVLPEDHKDLILALTESQSQNREAFDDIIQGKGMGMIMLLSGPPGVGKTLTAESVAETMKAPLYMMSAGDLGTRSSEVESNLSNVLEMCTKWNAILLLDEADVFLEQRSAHDLERNKLVSIFLRILEYYEGILFLTTNRVHNIDAAFRSRIHISMAYKNLSFPSRRHVWANFIAASSQGHGITDQDLDRLAAYAMNGREIKNVLKTAQLLASKKGTKLRFEYVDVVLSIEKRYVVAEEGYDQ